MSAINLFSRVRNSWAIAALMLALTLLLSGYLIYQWKQPRVIDRWIKIYPNGERKQGVTIETEEGRGYEGEADDLPGLVISKYSGEINLSYIDPAKRKLSVTFNGTVPSYYDLDASYVDGDYLWSTQASKTYVTIREVTQKAYMVTTYHADTKKVERDVYLNKDQATPWDGMTTELTPNGKWRVTRYNQGQPKLIAENITIEEANRLRDSMSIAAEMDHNIYVRTRIKDWQHEMARLMNLPNLENSSYQKLDELYFR